MAVRRSCKAPRGQAGSNGRVMDGMHSAAKAALLGKAEILSVRVEKDPEPDHVGKRPDDL